MSSVRLLIVVFFFLFVINEANAQADTTTKQKQISAVDVNRNKNQITITYADGSSEIMTEQEANKKGLIHNGGYGNQQTSNGPGKKIELRKKGFDSPKPVFVLDGREITEGEMNNINPSSIESINVLKDKSATDKYGVKGKNGVVEINLKKNEPAPDEFNGKKIYEWIDAEKSDEIISFNMTIDNNEGNLQTVEHKGSIFTAADRLLLQNAKPERLLTIDRIVIKREGIERRLPSRTYNF